MRKNTKIILVALVIIIGLVVANVYLFRDTISKLDESPTVSSVDEKEAAKVEAARALEEGGDVAGAAEALKAVIAETPDDIVYERAIRDYSRILAKTDPQAALDLQIILATDMRIRASARAGAIESIVDLYYADSGLSREVLDATIFANDTFAALRYAGETSVTSERLLLEYANRVSVRPLVSAYLLREYGIAWYAGEEDVKESFDQTLATYRSLIIDVVETSPVLPRAHAAAAAGLFYAHAADTSDVDYIVDRDMQQAIDSAESLTKFFAEVMSASVEEFQYKSVSPLMQFYTMFNAAADVPYVSATESLLASYDGYLLSNPYLNVAADFPELVEVAERVRLTATADVGS